MNNHASLIVSLHARYEAAWAEYNRLDDANRTLSRSTNDESRPLSFRYEEAMQKNQEEIDALRVLVLFKCRRLTKS